MSENGALLEVRDLRMHFPITRGVFRRRMGSIRAVDGISFSIRRGETLGLVGESGCGKTTTARCIVQLERPTAGEVRLSGTTLTGLRGEELRKMRRHMQMIFQDPYSSLNSRLTVGAIVGEPLLVHGMAKGRELQDLVQEMLSLVGLNPSFVDRYPHEFSGGQRQRIGIARALAVRPHLVICDEPISSLDVSIQAQIINMLQDLQARLGLTYLFIAHDLSVVRHVSDRVGVMYLGKIVEMADRKELYRNPLHPYTRALLSAVPVLDPVLEAQRERIILEGDIPSPASPPAGCRFSTRCPSASARCHEDEPVLHDVGGDHWVSCLDTE